MEKIITESSIKKRWYSIFVALIAVALLLLAIRGVSWNEIITTLFNINPLNILAASGIGTLSLFFRSLRWRVLVSAKKSVSPLKMFWATCIGYFGNTFLPARAGELLRSVVLGKETGIETSFILATAITERSMDVIALVLVCSFTISSVSGVLPDWLLPAIQWMAAGGFLALFLLLIAPRLENSFHKLIRIFPLPEYWKSRLVIFTSQFILGTQALIHPARAAGFILLTPVVWLLDAFGSVIIANSMGLPLNLGQALLFLAALGLSSAVPSTPGYIGIYQFVAVTILPVFGINSSQAITFIVVIQAINVLLNLIFGLFGLIKMGVNPGDVFNRKQTV
jgi:glycosyltransferase 2 family protein